MPTEGLVLHISSSSINLNLFASTIKDHCSNLNAFSGSGRSMCGQIE